LVAQIDRRRRRGITEQWADCSSGDERRWFRFPRPAAPLVSALAASLLIVTLTLSVWVVSLRRESLRLSAQIDARDRAIRGAQDRLSDAATQISQLRREMEAFLQPQLNTPVIDLEQLFTAFRG
jgi:hypothetical protein